MENQNENKQIIEQEVQTEEKASLLTSLKTKVSKMSKKSIILLSAGALLLVTGGFVVAEVYENRLDALETQVEQSLGLSDNDDDNQVTTAQSVVASSNTTTASSTTAASSATATVVTAEQVAANYGITLVESSELDGTYTATVGNDSYTLTIKGNQGSLVEVDNDGEQDSELVVLDLEKKIAYIDGEADTYSLSGSTLTLTEVDTNDTTLDKISFTKQ
ncbi:TPA: hypothetical protein TXJ16_001606 [Streptococcus suis]|uniref:Lipoprotein n=1 Tax=Streptococcus suis TaxID=1307 RepID=A0A4T2GMV0_STRSU|nr:hypothetical protein [Streptococcus suis]MBM7270017.1 hypothetical protein [Streptococcus suis]TIH99270.1 hypothetical protein FAJ39_06830 [Streptococcus suis]HEL1587074.1 hypothetical protein [Streptococcus suis]